MQTNFNFTTLYNYDAYNIGSAADVCELKAKDEVVAINKQNISQMTFAQLDQNVRDAVQIGQIELRVKRYLGSGGGKFKIILSEYLL